MIRSLGVLGVGFLILASADLSAQAIDTTSRSTVVGAYNNTYLPTFNVPSGWNGNVAGCNAGTTTGAYQQATIDTANFYRAMAGLNPVTLLTDAGIVARAQQAALISSANTTLSHTPPTTAACYSPEGYNGASNSNLALSASGPNAIDLYISDDGNSGTLGHRRWVLFQYQVGLATGDIVNPGNSYRSSNALRVLPASSAFIPPPIPDAYPGESQALFWSTPPWGPYSNPVWVAWPSPNFVPYQLMPTSGYWSIAYPGADFSGASVTMTTAGGTNVPTVVSPLPVNYGDNTLMFVPSGLSFAPGMADTSYKIVVSNVTGGGPTSYCYTVTVFDPATSASDAAPDLCASTHTLAVTVTGNGSVSDGPLTIITACTTAGGAACSGTYATGTTVTLTATADAGYTFSKWSGDCSGTTSTTQVIMSATRSCTAEFVPVAATYTLSVAVTGNGSVSDNQSTITACTTAGGAACSGTYATGTTVTLTATADAGYTFSKWSGDCSGTTSTTQVTMSVPHNCTAEFVPVAATYTLSVTVTGNGSVSDKQSTITACTTAGGAACSGTYASGTTVTLTATEDAGYTFSKWSGDCSGTASTTQVTMSVPHGCTAEFVPVVATPTLSVTVTGNGSVSDNQAKITTCTVAGGAACSGTYTAGTLVTLTATAAAGSFFAGWGGDCISAGTASTVSVTMGADHTCSAAFTPTPPPPPPPTVTLTFAVSGNSGSGSISISDNQTPPHTTNCSVGGATCSGTYITGTLVTLTATAAAGYSFVGWGGDCTSAGSSLTATVTVSAGLTCSAVFALSAPAPGSTTSVPALDQWSLLLLGALTCGIATLLMRKPRVRRG
ncbi:MAG: InlB B-repeat-containing protein [Rhodanobacter sp.]|jgi:hypothetical protein|nr:InlB B-repeat-containing protein [Rhodanobacter sp.]